jgi:FdhD protein
MIEKKKIIRVNNLRPQEIEDYISQEEIFEIMLNGKLITRQSVSPEDLEAWAIGYLWSSGLLKRGSKFSVQREGGRINIVADFSDAGGGYFFGTSGCGAASENLCFEGLRDLKEVNVLYHISKILDLFKKFNSRSSNFKLSGSLHSAALCQRYEVSYFSEDIGRHNAVDKVIGKAMLNDAEFSSFILLTTGRISVDIVKKAIVVGIPVIVSHSGPTTFAVNLAESYGVTLIGFLRGQRCNIYSWDDRILIK